MPEAAATQSLDKRNLSASGNRFAPPADSTCCSSSCIRNDRHAAQYASGLVSNKELEKTRLQWEEAMERNPGAGVFYGALLDYNRQAAGRLKLEARGLVSQFMASGYNELEFGFSNRAGSELFQRGGLGLDGILSSIDVENWYFGSGAESNYDEVNAFLIGFSVFKVTMAARAAGGSAFGAAAKELGKEAIDQVVTDATGLPIGLTDLSGLKQAGSKFFTGSADEAYEAIRRSTTDVATIAENTGIKASNIQNVKDHLFHQEHVLDRYVDLGVPAEMRRFDSDRAIAEAWKRLENGTHTPGDLQLLRHEAAESHLMRRWNDPSYSRAHDRAEVRFPAPPLDE